VSRDRIAVWSWSLEEDALSPDAGEALLSDDEKARGQRFVAAHHRRRFVAGRARLRSLLGEHLGLAPKAIVFVQNEFGKPSVAQAPSVHFSLSHSEDQALLAVSDTLLVGADLEHIRALEHLDLARRYFHPAEIAAIEDQPKQSEQLRAFFRIWTLKEAVVKALGKGLSMPLDRFAVSIAASPPTMALAPEDTSGLWWLHQTTDDYCRALAAPGGADVELIQRTV
jgi:4'-phosphopantetheinyl transferase